MVRRIERSGRASTTLAWRGGRATAAPLLSIAIVAWARTAAADSFEYPTATLVNVTSGVEHVPGANLSIIRYTCPSAYPHLANWKNNSSGGTTSEWASGGNGTTDNPDWFEALMGGGLTGADVGTYYVCSAIWPPTTSDCGGEGERVCWGAVLTPIETWQRADWMFFHGGSGLCDHGLVAGLDFRCRSSTRHQLDTNGWEHWAADNQRYGVSAKEPMNWTTYFGSHESFNTRADAYTFPSHTYSLSDQLVHGARYIDLRARWIATALQKHERLSHTTGDSSTVGGSVADRPFTYGIQEIGTWLAGNPDQVIRLEIGVGYDSAGAPGDANGTPGWRYITDPLDKYLAGRILTPSEWCHYLHENYPTIARPFPENSTPDDCTSTADAGAPYVPYRWPTMSEMRALGRQVLLTTNGGHLDGRHAFEYATDSTYSGNDMDGEAGYGNGFARSFDGSACLRSDTFYLYNSDATPQQRDYVNRATTTEEEARVFGQVDFAYDSWTGYLVANEDDVEQLATEVDRLAGADQATSMEAVTLCKVGLMKLDEVGSDNAFESETETVDGLTDRRRGVIWSWAPDDYGTNGGPAGANCAALDGDDDRWHSSACSDVHPFACARPRSGDPTTWNDLLHEDWKVTVSAGTWDQGTETCDREFGSEGYVYSSPRNGLANQKLIAARDAALAAGTDLWVSYSDAGGTWHAGAPPLVSIGGVPSSWVNHDVVLSLDAVNKADPTTEIATISYTLTGAENASGTISGASGSVTVTHEGITAAEAQATDEEGNTSTALSVMVQIDRTPPAVTYAGNTGAYLVDQTIVITCSTADNLSGVQSNTCAGVNAPAWTFTAGSHTLTATAVDFAGNVGNGSTTFTVTASPDSLCSVTKTFVPNQSTADAMCKVLTKGNVSAYINMVQARLNSGQITASQAATLTYFAGTL